MKSTGRWIILVIVLGIIAKLTVYSQRLWSELMSEKWTTPLQPRCLVGGYVVGVLVGLAVGIAIFYIARRRYKAWYYSVLLLCSAVLAACVLGTIVAFFTVGFMWPSEMVYGFDGDHIIPYGMLGSALGAVITGGLAAIRR